MKKYSWIVPLVGAVIVFAVMLLNRTSTPAAAKGLIAAHGTTQSPCVGRKKCLVAVIAPWCGYCRRSTPMIKSLLQKYGGSGDLMVNAVVTADEDQSTAQYAGELGAGAFSDPGNAFSSAMGVRGFPTWVLFDEQGRTVKSASGAFPSADQLFSYMNLAQ